VAAAKAPAIARRAAERSRSETMQIPREAVLLRIFIGEDDQYGHQPLYEAIVQKAREMHLAGATVLRGPMGYGYSSRLHTDKILRLSFDLPLVIEIIDSEEKISELLPVLDTMMTGGLVTLEEAQVLKYGAKEDQPPIGPNEPSDKVV
jgi:PII-like signaling protein